MVRLFVLLQVQVAQAAVHLQAFGQFLHPCVSQSCHPQMELQQAAVHHQHVSDVDHPILLHGSRASGQIYL